MSGAATPRPPNFLRSIYPDGFDSKAVGKPRPYVTLTYAQSIDGCIAGKGGTQILLSGKESMVMTHWYVGAYMHLNQLPKAHFVC